MALKLDYEGIKDLSKELGRPSGTLIALSAQADPFYILPYREAAARWAADLWLRLKMPIGLHYRGIHYRIISQPHPILTVDGKPYENTMRCWKDLCNALRDAHYLGLVPDNAFVERRSDLPIVFLAEPRDASTYIENEEPDYRNLRMPDLPALVLDRPVVPQPYHLEIFVEKSTMNDVFLPIAQELKLNLVTGVGEMSATRVREFIDRAEASGRPVRILYISDFDPTGYGMPISVAVKIQFELYRQGLDLDIQVRPIALTYEQCREYRLPRTPIKEGDTRGAGFEDRFGEGATELDALEALHPGLLRQIIIKEINRYWNPDHDDAVATTCRDIEDQLEEITSEIHAEHQDEIDALKAEWQEITNAYRAWLELAKPLWHAVADKCDNNRPDLDDVEWVESFEADEDPDPLFDSTRDYVEQVDRFKQHRGKPTEKREVSRQVVCETCGTIFEATHPSAKTYSNACRKRRARDQAAAAYRATVSHAAADICDSQPEAGDDDGAAS